MRDAPMRFELRCRMAAPAALLAACSASLQPPDLGQLYDRIAQASHDVRNPVVLIPGILGSNLVEEASGRIVWGSFHGDYADPDEPDGARLLALPMNVGTPLSELTDGVVQGGALESLHIHFLGLPLGVNAYVNILLALGVGGYRDEALGLSGAVDYGSDHFTCFQFAYDWRQDISKSAGQLHAFLLEKEAYIREEYARRGIQKREIRFDVVAHSMGGLVLRYYLRHGVQELPDDGSLPELTWEGAERVERAVLVATPNAGSIQAFNQLLDGYKLGLFLARYRPGILGTMPAVYQMLPRPRHGAWIATEGELGDPLDPELWERSGWGLADPREADVLAALLPAVADPDERRRIALDHLAKCLRRARQFFAAMDRPASPPPGTELFLVAGDAIATPATIEVDPRTGRTGDITDAPGDETVLRSSALMDERLGGGWQPVLVSPIDWARVMFFFENHLGLTKSPAFIDNLLFLLLEEPRS